MGEVLQVQADFSGFEEVIKKMKEVLKPFESLRAGGIGGGSPNNNNKPDKKNLFADNLNTSNKSLKEQNKLLGINIQKLNLIKLLTSKLKWGALGLAGLAAGGITGGIAAGISAMNGTLQTNTRAKNTGLNFGEANALGFAGKMTGIGEDTLISSIEGLQTSLKDYSKWGDLASLGLNAQDLEKKNPAEALFEVLESMKDSGLPQHLKKQIIDNLGIPFDQFQFVLKEGTGEMQKYFKEGMGMFGGKSGKSLMAGERALIRFTTILKDVSQNIGGKIAPALTTGLKLITPYIYKLADGFTWLLGKVINKRNLNIISGLFNSIGKIGGDLISKGVDIFSGGKDLFKNMFAGFSVDTGGWSSILKELGGGFLDGISKLWDTLKPNLISIGQSLVDVWAMIEPDLLAFLKFWKENILPPLQSIAGSAINILGKVLKRVIADFKWFYQLVRPYFKYIGNIVSKWYNTLAGIFKMFDTGTDEEGGLIGGLASLLSPISNLKLAFDLIKTAVDFARDALNTFKTKITETWENVKNSWSRILLVIDRAVHRFTDAIMGFKILGKTVTEHFGGTYKPKYKSMNGWEQVLDKDGTYKWLSKNGGTAQYPEVRADNINDGVITKEGKIIKTDPQDYIFAMKQPQRLASSASGGGTYTININANVRHDNDVKQIRNELERLIRSFNAKR